MEPREGKPLNAARRETAGRCVGPGEMERFLADIEMRLTSPSSLALSWTQAFFFWGTLRIPCDMAAVAAAAEVEQLHIGGAVLGADAGRDHDPV
jgi:hypothetical protein